MTVDDGPDAKTAFVERHRDVLEQRGEDKETAEITDALLQHHKRLKEGDLR